MNYCQAKMLPDIELNKLSIHFMLALVLPRSRKNDNQLTKLTGDARMYIETFARKEKKQRMLRCAQSHRRLEQLQKGEEN